MSFGLMLLTAGTLLQIYVFCRAATVPAIARRVPRRILAASGLILWLAFLASRTVGRTAEGAAIVDDDQSCRFALVDQVTRQETADVRVVGNQPKRGVPALAREGHPRRGRRHLRNTGRGVDRTARHRRVG